VLTLHTRDMIVSNEHLENEDSDCAQSGQAIVSHALSVIRLFALWEDDGYCKLACPIDVRGLADNFVWNENSDNAKEFIIT